MRIAFMHLRKFNLQLNLQLILQLFALVLRLLQLDSLRSWLDQRRHAGTPREPEEAGLVCGRRTARRSPR
jgi:hypothetical protein